MKSFLLALSLIFTTSCFSQNLKDYRWKNRLVILVGDKNKPLFKKQEEKLIKLQKELDARQIILFQGNSEIINQLSVDKAFHGLILIGKDGGVKIKEQFIVEPKLLFSVIDGMPMRRAEIKQNKG